MKKWAFIDCFHKINFENIDFDSYERIVIFSSGDISLPAGEIVSASELTFIKTETDTQHQMTIALAYHASQYDVTAPSNIHFDIYSNDIESSSLEDCLRKSDRHCQLFNLPRDEKITLRIAVDNFIQHVCVSYPDKRNRPRSMSIYSKLLDCEWRFIRGRVKSKEILKQLDNMGAINYANNGIYFTF